ncbi:hypothetical protein AHF37_09231 [Paragonimus kellicotti]|nr:hypothetical protein AHF37_09231 [Paragonimus kellicotti]
MKKDMIDRCSQLKRVFSEEKDVLAEEMSDLLYCISEREFSGIENIIGNCNRTPGEHAQTRLLPVKEHWITNAKPGIVHYGNAANNGMEMANGHIMGNLPPRCTPFDYAILNQNET